MMCDPNDYIKTWLRFHSDKQNPLLVKSLQWVTKIQCGNSYRGVLTFIELFCAVFLFIWWGNGVPTPLFLALHPWALPITSYIKGLRTSYRLKVEDQLNKFLLLRQKLRQTLMAKPSLTLTFVARCIIKFSWD